MMEVVATTGAIGCEKLQSNNLPPTNQHPVFFTGWMPFLSPNQQRQSTEGRISHSVDLLTPNSPLGLPTLSLTTNGSWLPLGRVAMPLISPLMPVPHDWHRVLASKFKFMIDKFELKKFCQMYNNVHFVENWQHRCIWVILHTDVLVYG